MTKQTAWRECLQASDAFGVRVAQSILGGQPLQHSHNNGDLSLDGSFVEVKVSGLSNGPIVEEEQLQHHYEATRVCDYVFVCYKNRGLWRGKIRNLPMRILRSKGKEGLQKFFASNARVVYVLPVAIVWALYEREKKSGHLKTYEMRTGPKTYFRVRYPHLNVLMGPGHLKAMNELGLNPAAYLLTCRENVKAHSGRHKARVTLCRISALPVEPDDSFDVQDLERPA